MKEGIIKKNIKQLGSMLSLILPKGKGELFLLLGLILFYSSYTWIIIFYSDIIDGDYWGDIYFSFDSQCQFHGTIYVKKKHPLIEEFMAPLMYLGNALKVIAPKLKTILFVLFCELCISFSVLFIFKYLKNVTKIKGFILYVITLFYALFSTNLILSFTTESYTMTIFWLAFLVYFYSLYIKEQKKIEVLPHIFSVFILWGITSVNAVRGLIMITFAEKKLLSLVKRFVIPAGILGTIMLVVLYFYNDFLSDYSFIAAVFGPAPFTVKEVIYQNIDLFFGTPIFFSNVFLGVSLSYTDMIQVDFYHHWWQYAFIGVLFVMILLSIVRNWRNELVWLLVALVGIDIMMHAVLGFGRAEATIYGGHWVYVVPLFLGWLYTSLNDRYKKICAIILSCLLIAILCNNLYQLSNFIEIAVNRFPA